MGIGPQAPAGDFKLCRPVGSHFRYFARLLHFCAQCAMGPTTHDTQDLVVGSDSCAARSSCRIMLAMRASLDWVTLLLRCTRAFFRTPREQAIGG